MQTPLSRHAQIRFRQRGIREDVLSCLNRYGRTQSAPGGAERIFLSRRDARYAVKELKKIIQVLEHAAGVTVLDGGAQIITGYRNDKGALKKP